MSIGPLNKDLPIPLYHQAKLALRNAIEAGEWESGAQLPNEDKLAESFGVSKVTVRQALQELASLGYVRREQGRGTFVSRPKFDHGPRELTSFSEEMQRHDLKASSRVIEAVLTEAGDRVGETLQIAAAEPVFLLKRLRLADAEPMGIQTAYIPAVQVPGILDEDFGNASLYEVLRTRYGLAPARARETYSAVPVEPESAELLEIAPGTPVLAVERVTYLPGGKPLEFVESIMRSDRYSITLELVANRVPQAIRDGGLQ
jgi:GntR family transcriptional regulator